MTSETVFARFKATALARPEAPFLHVLEETARLWHHPPGPISYGAMLAAAETRAQALRAAGIGAGDRVGLLLENRPVFLECFLALNAIGASAVPFNPDLRRAELSYMIGHSEMRMVLTLPERVADLSEAARAAGAQPLIATPDTPLPPAPAPAPQVLPERAREAALLYTSGTTGQPKGCILSNLYFLHSGDWYAGAGGLISLGAEERMLTPLPLFHMNALAVSVMGMVTVGGCLILLDRFHPRSWWASVREARATCLHYLGVMPSMLMAAPEDPGDRIEGVRFGFGAGIDARLHAPFEARFGFPLIEAWACTETGSGATISAHEEPRQIGTACFGAPPPEVDIRIVDDAGGDIDDDTPGELLVRRRGDNPAYGFFDGYLKNPEATAEVWRDGWFHTGDVVARDATGQLHFVDRKKNIIRRSGENIAAVEVETVLNRHPAVAQAAAAPLACDIRGEEVAVLIRPASPGADAATAREIAQWALAEVAYYKVPGWVGFVEALPLTGTAKIQRGELRKLVAAEAEAGRLHDLRALKKRGNP
ncbi:MAG: AMP-binding protein, partial [Rhodobacteraceae bacterium]|nr:AMP-binding protein [Paracoccaceae bacterium]